MTDLFSGDPKITLDENGADLVFKGGQPVMDQGLENLVFISLFTRAEGNGSHQNGWVGNIFFTEDSKKIGSDYQETSEATITLESLNNIRQAAIQALESDAFGDVGVKVSNPNSYRIDTDIRIEPPGRDTETLQTTKNGTNWIAQKLNPAYLRV